MIRRYASAKGSAAGGVSIHTSTWRAAGMPIAAITTDSPMKNVALVPITQRACFRSSRPIACATRMLAAMPTPNTAPSSRNITLFALAVAVSACSPRKRPTHTALMEPLSDCNTLPPRMGSANANRVRAIGPSVRVRCWIMAAPDRQASLAERGGQDANTQ